MDVVDPTAPLPRMREAAVSIVEAKSHCLRDDRIARLSPHVVSHALVLLLLCLRRDTRSLSLVVYTSQSPTIVDSTSFIYLASPSPLSYCSIMTPRHILV